jgi:MFS family permease
MLLALAIQQPLVVMVGFGLVGFGVSSVIPIVYMLSAKTDSMPPSTALAAVSSVGFSGFLFGPPIIGFVAQETGLRIALLIVALLGTLIWWLSLRIRYTK